jgi:hypothetical protein
MVPALLILVWRFECAVVTRMECNWGELLGRGKTCEFPVLVVAGKELARGTAIEVER